MKRGYVPDRGRCVCGKRNYRINEAKLRARQLRRETHERLGYYRCERSEFWHVGHKMKGT